MMLMRPPLLSLALSTLAWAFGASAAPPPPAYCNARPVGKQGEVAAALIDKSLELGKPNKGLAKDGGFGADSAEPVTEELIKGVVKRFGSAPLFWGRYISNRDERLLRPGELQLLAVHGIRVLPLAQQTLRFNDYDPNTKSTFETGQADGKCNASAFIDVFAVDEMDASTYHLYLNIEVDSQTPVNAAYYKGWVAGLEDGVRARGRKIRLRPAVYIGTLGSIKSWEALSRATSDLGEQVDLVWIARYGSGYSGSPPLDCKDIDIWRDHSKAGGITFPAKYGVAAWQYQENCSVKKRTPLVDISLLSPIGEVRGRFLNGLVDPRAAAKRHADLLTAARR